MASRRRLCEPEIAKDRQRGPGTVEAVDVEAGCAARQQRLALPRGEVDAELRHGFVIVPEPVEIRDEGGGQRRAAERGEALHLLRAQDGEDAGGYRHGHAERAGQVLDHPEVVGVVEEELREDEFGAVVDLVAQPPPVDLPRLRAVGMALGKAGAADRELLGPGLQDVDELVGVVEPAGRVHEVRLPRGRVAAQRQDVLDPEPRRLAEEAVHLHPREADAGDVRHRGQAVLPLQAVDDRQGLGARAAASGAVGDRAEVGPCRRQAG